MQPFSNGQFQNVVGCIPARNNQYIVIGAHYDGLGKSFGTTYNGADDNASGVAALIEIGRILSKETLEYGVIFVAFDGEEIGLLGSQHFASTNKEKDIVLMLSIDMVGHLRDEARLVYEGTGTIQNGDAFAKSSKVADVSVKTFPVAKNSGVLTDTFYFARKKIPSINITTDLGTSDYHLPTDDIATLDIAGIASISEQVALFVRTVQGKVVSTGINLYGSNAKTRFGFSYSDGLVETRDASSEAVQYRPGFSLGVFGLFPIGYTLFGDHYIKGELAYENKTLATSAGDIKTHYLSVPISLATSTRILGIELLYPVGLYYSCLVSDGWAINQEAGLQMGIELKPYDNVSFLNHVSLAIDTKIGFQGIFPSNANNVAGTKSATFKLSYYF